MGGFSLWRQPTLHLTHLPDEILLMIFEHLSGDPTQKNKYTEGTKRYKALYNACLVNRSFHKVGIGFLYRAIDSDNLDFTKLCNSLHENRYLKTLVKCLFVTAATLRILLLPHRSLGHLPRTWTTKSITRGFYQVHTLQIDISTWHGDPRDMQFAELLEAVVIGMPHIKRLRMLALTETELYEGLVSIAGKNDRRLEELEELRLSTSTSRAAQASRIPQVSPAIKPFPLALLTCTSTAIPWPGPNHQKACFGHTGTSTLADAIRDLLAHSAQVVGPQSFRNYVRASFDLWFSPSPSKTT
jgi:hypothetical protein